MKIRLKDIAMAPNQTICFDYTMDLQKEELNFEFPFAEPVEISGQVAEGLGAIQLEARIETAVHTRCARCNRPVQYKKSVPVSFILTKELDRDEMDDIIVIGSDSVDLDEIMREELILNMETAVLCSPDCKGLCPRCGKDLNDGPCGCSGKAIDPRLQKLKDLLEH